MWNLIIASLAWYLQLSWQNQMKYENAQAAQRSLVTWGIYYWHLDCNQFASYTPLNWKIPQNQWKQLHEGIWGLRLKEMDVLGANLPVD